MAKILGLDLGSYSVKAVTVDSAQRGFGLKGYAEVRRAQEGDRLETLRAALTELVGKQPAPDQVVVALPGPVLVTHALTLPFTDSKRIEATLPFEVEGLLPFDLSEAVFDYQVAGQKENKSDILVGVSRREELQTLLAVLSELNLDPRIVTLPGLAYQNIMAGGPVTLEPVGEDEAVAVVDIGHERTSIAMGRPGSGVELARTFPGGGKDLTRALSREFEIPPEAAHEWKEQHGAVASAVVGPDAERAANAFVRGLAPVVRELRATFKAYSARARKQVVRVHLCGGTAKLRGLDELLGRELNLPTSLLKLPAEAGGALPAEQHPAAAQAVALALRGQASGARAPRFNLRRGEFAFKGDFDFLKERVGLLVSYGVTLLILLIAAGVVRNSVLARREQRVDAQLCDVTQRVLGQCEKNYERALNLLRGKESPAAVIPKVSAVELLSEMTERMPPDVTVTFDQIVVDLDRISLRGETGSSKLVDRITSSLKGYRCFQEVKQGKLEKSKDGKSVNFRLDIQVACPEQGAAPQG
jgi:general secretion pathway protein L